MYWPPGRVVIRTLEKNDSHYSLNPAGLIVAGVEGRPRVSVSSLPWPPQWAQRSACPAGFSGCEYQCVGTLWLSGKEHAHLAHRRTWNEIRINSEVCVWVAAGVNNVTLTGSWFQSAGVWSFSVDRFQWSVHHAGTQEKRIQDQVSVSHWATMYSWFLILGAGYLLMNENPNSYLCACTFSPLQSRMRLVVKWQVQVNKAAWLAVWDETLLRGLSLCIVFARTLSQL